MSARPTRHLALVHLDDSGEIVGRVDSEALQALEAKAEKLATDLANAEKDLRSKRRQIAELTRDRTRERLNHPDREFIVRVCRYWAAKCRPGNARIDPLAPNRFDAVAALAEMQVIETVEVDGKRRRVRRWRYGAHEFKAAIDGAAFDPFYITHKNLKKEPQNDLEQVCRDTTRFERSISKAPYEPVPLPNFTRLGPSELARAREARNDGRRVPSAGSPGPQSGGSHGSGRFLGATSSRLPLPVEGRWPHVQRGMGARAPGLPASWA